MFFLWNIRHCIRNFNETAKVSIFMGKSTFTSNDKLWQNNKETQEGKSFLIFVFKKKEAQNSMLHVLILSQRFIDLRKQKNVFSSLNILLHMCMDVLRFWHHQGWFSTHNRVVFHVVCVICCCFLFKIWFDVCSGC